VDAVFNSELVPRIDSAFTAGPHGPTRFACAIVAAVATAAAATMIVTTNLSFMAGPPFPSITG
jgi:hypothetical protein